MRKLAWIKSGSFVRAPLGEILNDVDVIDLHAKIEMKGTTRTGVEPREGRKRERGEKGHSESTIAQRTKREQVRGGRD